MVRMRFDSLGVAYFGKDNAGKEYYKTATGTNPVSLYYYHSDHLGSASLITDGAGHLNQHLAYIPNGEVFVNQCATSFDSRFKFTGKEMDEETGLYYFSQRYLDPKFPGFLSSDELREKHPNVGSYVYCYSNPLKYVDPDGRIGVLITANARATVLFLSGSVNVALGFSNNGVSFFAGPEFGVGAGLSFSAGVGIALYPTVTNSEQLGGWGANLGISVAGNGGDFTVSIQQDSKTGQPNDIKIGGAAAVPKLGAGAGAEGHMTASYAFLIGTVTWKEMKTKISEYANKLGLSPKELKALIKQGKSIYDAYQSKQPQPQQSTANTKASKKK